MIRAEKLAELKRYMAEFQTTTKEKVDDAPQFLGIERYRYVLATGQTLIREHVVKIGSPGSAVVILPVTKEGNRVLVVEPRVLTTEGVGIELPAGYIEDSEEPIIAAKRELVEETGYVPDHLIPLASYYQDQGCIKAIIKL